MRLDLFGGVGRVADMDSAGHGDVRLFESAGAELPLLTRVVITAGDAAQRYWWLLLLGLLTGVWLIRRQFRHAESRARIDRWLLRVPLLGSLLIKIDTARLARTLGTLLANGVPLLNALAIAGAGMAPHAVE